MMILSKQITKYRHEKGMTQEELARLMFVSRQTISKWELGGALPSIDNIILLSDILDISLDDLLKSRYDFPIPYDFGKPKNYWFLYLKMAFVLLYMIVMMTIILLTDSLTSYESVTRMLLIIFSSYPILLITFRNYNQYYEMFTITYSGLKVPKITIQNGLLHPLRLIKSMLGRHDFTFIKWSEIQSMEIYFDHTGYAMKEGSLGYRPRHIALMREKFQLQVITTSQSVHFLSLDELFYPKSEAAQYFLSIMDYFKSKDITIKDPTGILEVFEKEYSLIKHAYDHALKDA